MTDQVPAPKPGGWFAALWIAAFVAPIASQPSLLAGTVVWVLVSSAATGILLAPYVPRPWVWTRNTLLALAAIVAAFVLLGLAWPFLLPIVMVLYVFTPVIVPFLGLLVGAAQSSAFLKVGQDATESRRPGLWMWVSGTSWLAMTLVFWYMTGKPLRLDVQLDLRVALIALLTGGAVSCAGMLWILRKIPERRNKELRVR
jgi:hypothetical protein